MNKSREKSDTELELEVMRVINNKPDITQRELANKLGHSLGKLNYCLRELKFKGFLKIDNFKKNPNKLNYLYVLTPKGIAAKTKLMLSFMNRKMKEYDELKKELENEK
jgi:EPS-associated MarR family transcriptional regulator|tara:strand:+ start:385 stop:708 length:324 start_codon:yes stop_codon:yes gene_type:complete